MAFISVTNKRQPVSATCAKMAKWDTGDAGWVTGGSGIRREKVVCGCWSVLGVCLTQERLRWDSGCIQILLKQRSVTPAFFLSICHPLSSEYFSI